MAPKFKQTFSGYVANRRGNLSIITAISAIPMIGAAGLAIDFMRIEDTRAKMAAALDAAVLAGVVTTGDSEEEAEAYFDKSFSSDLVVYITKEFKETGDTRVDGTISAVVQGSFSSVMGFTGFPIEIEAAAEVDEEKTGKLCLMTINPTAGQELLANSGADVKASSCEIHVKSTANPAAIFNSGSSIDASKICIAGSNIIKNGGTQKNLETGCTTLSDPYAGKIAEPASSSCDYNNGNYSGNTTINPGVYCGWHNFNSNAKVTLNPGTYIIKSGGWNVNGGEWDGDGVTFYFADTSKIQFNSAVKATLKPPKSGTYEDILFAEKSGLSQSQFIFDDSKGFDMWGVMYLPSRQVVFNSDSKNQSHKITAVFDSVIFNQTNWTLTAYEVDGGKSSAGASARLVE